MIETTASATHLYKPAPAVELVGFDPSAHVYTWNGWNPPSVTRILGATGVSAFDPTYWRLSLLKRGIKPERAEEWITDLVWDGHAKTDARAWVQQFVNQPMSPEDAETYMSWRRDSAAARGTRIHARIEHFFSGHQDAVPGLMDNPNLLARDDAWWQGWLQFFSDCDFSEVFALEAALINTSGVFCGTVDFAAELRIPSLDADGGPVRRVIDWKTIYPPEKKVSGKPWQGMQLAAYGATLNRLMGAGVQEAVNVHVYPGGYALTTYKAEDLVTAWRTFLGYLWGYWTERADQGLMYHSPAMAREAVERMREEWGAFE